MKKVKLFIENFLIYGIGGVISKIVPLAMVPIVTRIMPNSDYYGLCDLSNTVVSFASAFAVMGMYDAMYRMFFEKNDEEYKKEVCSTALLFTLGNSALIFLILILIKDRIAYYFFSDVKYAYIVYLSAMAALVNGTNSIVAAPTRMQNNRKVFLIANTLSPILSYSISIPMLLAGYYTIALPLAAVASGITLEFSFWWINKKWFSFKRFNSVVLKHLLKIALPLLPNFIIYWLFNSCDKVMIINMLNISAAGVYSVASKLGQCSQLIYMAFAGGWQFFAFSTMGEENQVKNNSLVFEYLGIISFAFFAFVCAISYPLFKLLFTEEYLSGYVVAPYLFLAPLLQMLFQVAANQFLVIKKTWPNTLILLVGAIINITINFLLIPALGIEGASLATLLGYVVSDIACVIVLFKMKLIILEKKFYCATAGLIIYFLIWRLFITSSFVYGIALATILVFFYVYLYRKELKILFSSIKK